MMKRNKNGDWVSGCTRWRVERTGVGRYDLIDQFKNDERVSIGLGAVADCESAARGIEWSEEQENPKA